MPSSRARLGAALGQRKSGPPLPTEVGRSVRYRHKADNPLARVGSAKASERQDRSVAGWYATHSPVPTNLMPQFARHSFSQQMWGANMRPPELKKDVHRESQR